MIVHCCCFANLNSSKNARYRISAGFDISVSVSLIGSVMVNSLTVHQAWDSGRVRKRAAGEQPPASSVYPSAEAIARQPSIADRATATLLPEFRHLQDGKLPGTARITAGHKLADLAAVDAGLGISGHAHGLRPVS